MKVFLVPLQTAEHCKNIWTIHQSSYGEKPIRFDSEIYVWGKTQVNYSFVMDNTKQILLVLMKHNLQKNGAKSGCFTNGNILFEPWKGN